MKSDVELDKTCLHVFMGHVYGPGIYSGTHYAVPCFSITSCHFVCLERGEGGELYFLMFLLGVIWR